MPERVDKGVTFARAEGVDLRGDLYLPSGLGPHPVLLMVPGGGWRRGDKAQLAHWGNHFADAGMAVFIIDYRRAHEGPIWPKNLEDVSAALEFVKSEGAALGLDPARIGILGASAGAHLGALAALKDDAVKLFVGVYGVYDLALHWEADRPKAAAPGEDPTSRMLGATPQDNPKLYVDASPLQRIAERRGALEAVLIHGEADTDILPEQSEHFAQALRAAGSRAEFFPVPGAGHFWFSQQAPEPGTYSGQIADRLVAFVKNGL
jgi:acetyl esterase/lipase